MSNETPRRALPSSVVSNTGPLIALSRVGRLDLIPRLFPSVIIPRTVEQEFRQGIELHDRETAAWLANAVVRDVGGSPDLFLLAELDMGEAAVIEIARETASAVLMDERRGRRIASMVYGLEVIGTGRLLIEAKERGCIESIRPLMEQMRIGGYYLSDRLFDGLCREAGEAR